jgi:hypothetical protein
MAAAPSTWVISRMTTEWDDLVKSLRVSLDLGEVREKRDLYHESMIGELLAIAKGGLKPSEKNIRDLQNLADDVEDDLTECTECGWEGYEEDKEEHDCAAPTDDSEDESEDETEKKVNLTQGA